MEELLKLIQSLREKSSGYGDKYDTIIKERPPVFTENLFNMVFNKLTVGYELLNFYYDIWKGPGAGTLAEIERKRNQNAERVVTINRMIFIETLSSTEYFLKNYIQNHTSKVGEIAGRIYLRKIMNHFEEKGLISNTDFNLWDGLIELRNSIVHNNAISEITKVYEFPLCNLAFEKGSMVKGNLNLFLHLIDWVLDSMLTLIIRTETW